MRYAIAPMMGVALAAPRMPEEFALLMGGVWICADGYLQTQGTYMPPEFKGVEWWKARVAGRTDGVHSDMVFVGWDYQPDNRVLLYVTKRGAGYCNTQRPYTCSPNGKLP